MCLFKKDRQLKKGRHLKKAVKISNVAFCLYQHREKMSTEKPTSLAKFFLLLREPCEALTMYYYQQAASAALKMEQIWSFKFGNTLWKLVNQQLPVLKPYAALTMYYHQRFGWSALECQVRASHGSRSCSKNFASLLAFQSTSSLCADTSKGHVTDLDSLF